MQASSVSQWKAKSWTNSSQKPKNHPYDPNVHRGFSHQQLSRLVELIKNFNDEFVYDTSVDVWKNDRLWGIISNELNDQRLTATACKTEFSKLFGRYFCILKQQNFEGVLKFPFFKALHDIDLSGFSKDLTSLKTKFDEVNKDRVVKEFNNPLQDNGEGPSRTFRYSDIDEIDSGSLLDIKDKILLDTTITDLPKTLETKEPLLHVYLDIAKTFRGKLYIHDINNKELLVAVVQKWNYRFSCISNEIVFDANEAWETVANELMSEIPDYSAAHCAAHFYNLVYQYRHILHKMTNCPAEKVEKFWPFWRKFHFGLKMDAFMYDARYSKSTFDNCPKEYVDYYQGGYYPPNVIPKNFYRVSFKDEKEKLLKLIKKYEEDFITLSKAENVWDTDKIWKYIVKDMKNVAEKSTMAKCKHYFIYLLDQYISVLKDLPHMSVVDAQDLFPLFNYLHKELNLTAFNSNIQKYRKKFNERKTSKLDSSSMQDPSKPTTSKTPAASEASKVNEEEEEYDEDQENIELVLNIQENIKIFKDFKLSDEDVWMRIALNLKNFEPEAFEKGIAKWKDRFYALMRRFLRYSQLSDEEAQQKWVLYNQFKSLDLNPFLDRLQNPITKSKK